MGPIRSVLISILLLLSAAAPALADKSAAHKALQPFNDLIGDWRATGTPEGTREEQQRGFWTEALTWSWAFKGDDAWLTVTFDKGKYFRKGELRYRADKELYQLTLSTPDREGLVFTGKLEDRRLTLTREDEAAKETQQLVVTLLHANRFLYRYEVRPEGKKVFTRLYQVGATKEGEPFAAEDNGPECIVSGGRGTIKVTHNGQTYYVCCTGCRTEFLASPEKYIKEYEEKKKKNGK
jgi:YHS domain-containing protein